MAYSTITIGNSATDRASTAVAGSTYVVVELTATATGIINSFALFFVSGNDGAGVKVGTFSGNVGTATYQSRDSESIGAVTSGSKQTFTGLNCDVVTGDFNGIYFSGGVIEAVAVGGPGYYLAYDTFDGVSRPYYGLGAFRLSEYGTGVTIPDAPTSVAATDNLYDKVTITWTAGTGETDGHRVYRDGVDISGVVAHGTATYNDTTAVAGTTYSYTVKAINPAGLSAASSADNGVKLAASSSFIQGIMKHNFIPAFIGGR